MPNLSQLLRNEIVRLARKELRRKLEPLRKQVAAQRSTIAGLRRQLVDVAKSAKRQARASQRSVVVPSEADTAAGRFSAKGVKSLRARLGLSAAQFGRLVNVTGATIFNWESGKARPQRAQLEALRGIRGMGKRAATERLEELDG